MFLLNTLKKVASYLIYLKASMLLFYIAPYSIDIYYNLIRFIYKINFINLIKSFIKLLRLSKGTKKELKEVDKVILKSIDS